MTNLFAFHYGVCHSVPTPQLTFGSTPTVSKDTTGPPTGVLDRPHGMTRNIPLTRPLEHKTYRNTECKEIYAGTPKVCVYVCTDILTIYAGEKMVSKDTTSYETECPDQ